MAEKIVVLFAHTFKHATSSESHIDEIKFKKSVIIREVRVVPAGVVPHASELPSFTGATGLGSVWFQAFALHSKKSSLQANRFHKIVHRIRYSDEQTNTCTETVQDVSSPVLCGFVREFIGGAYFSTGFAVCVCSIGGDESYCASR